MTVPALTTSDIATFAYYLQTGCTYIQLADVLPVLHSYQQHAEYVDGTIKIFDTGSESAAPNNYVLVNVRIRADGWIMAWFPKTLMTGTADSGSSVTVTDTGMTIQLNGETSAGSVQANELAGYIFKPTSGPLAGNEYCIKSNTATTITLHLKYGDNVSVDVGALTDTDTYEIIQSRGNLVWWGHHSSTDGNPTSQSTRLGRALYEMWEALKANQQGGSGTALSYDDVGYWDYEYTSATHLYIFGHSIHTSNTINDKYYYCTIPVGVTVYNGILNYGGYPYYQWSSLTGYIEAIAKYSYSYNDSQVSNGFVSLDQTSVFSSNYGRQKTMRHRTDAHESASSHTYGNQAIILLTSG